MGPWDKTTMTTSHDGGSPMEQYASMLPQPRRAREAKSQQQFHFQNSNVHFQNY